MRLFTTLLVALLSIVGASNLKAQVSVSYEDNATAPNDITTGYYVIKAKAKTIADCWLYMDNTTTRATADIEYKNIWYIEKNDNNTLYIKNVLTDKYFSAGNNANMNAARNKSDASQFSISTSFTTPGTITKLNDEAVVLYVGTPTTTENRQLIHTNGSDVSSFYLTTWESNTSPSIDGASAITQFAFYKATINDDLTASPVTSENCLYYLQNKSTGLYLGKNASTGTGCYVTSQSEAKKVYLEKQADGKFKIISDNSQITFSNTVWYMSLTNNDGNKVYFTLTNAGDDYYYINNINGSKIQYWSVGTVGNNINCLTSQTDACKWAFIPANESATTARDLTLLVKFGDYTHGNLATFSASYPVSLPEGYEAFTATHDATSNVINITKLEGNVIPANTGVLIKGDEGTPAMKPTLEAGTAVTNNKLMSVGDAAKTFTDDEKSGNNIYLLGRDNDNSFCFRIMNTEGTQTIAAHKAYILLDNATDAASLKINFGGEVTNINNAAVNDTNTKDNVYYDLSGRRVMRPQHGLYIVNGKKVIIK